MQVPEHHANSSPSATCAFHDRPLCTVAIGWLFGTLLVRVLAPPNCYIASILILVLAGAARWSGRKNTALCTLCIAAALVSAGLRYPLNGVFPYAGPVLPLPETGALGTLHSLRQVIGTRILRLFLQNGEVAVGMLLGEKSAIAADVLTAFEHTGILHLLAVSGLHVSVLTGVLILLIRRNAWMRLTASALFLVLYALLTALSPSVIRASVLLICALLARPLRRRSDAPSNLALAFLIILLLNPQALFYTGFQLSFCAVYGLVLLTRPFARPFAKLGTAASRLLGATLAVTVSTLPAMAQSFGRVQLTSMLANLFVLPIVPVFLIPAFCGVVLSIVYAPLCMPVIRLARLALNVIVTFARAGGALDIIIPAPGWMAYLLYLAALLYLSPLCLLNKEKQHLYSMVLLIAGIACWVIR